MDQKKNDKTYQEEGIGQKSVDEYRPANPPAGALSTVGQLGDGHGDDDADKLVARVRDEVVQLGVVGDAQEVAAEFEGHDLHHDDHQHRGGGEAEQLRLELAAQAGDDRRQEDVGDDGHDGDVHVRAVDVVARREVPPFLAVGAHGLLARPRLVPPGEEDEEELVDDVRVCHVKVVLERIDVDVAVKLEDARATTNGREGAVD